MRYIFPLLITGMIISLTISPVYAFTCYDDYDLELKRYNDLSNVFKQKLDQFNGDEIQKEKIRKSLNSDPLGVDLNKSKQCLHNFDHNSHDDLQQFLITLAGAITGAVLAVFGTEKVHQRALRNKGKNAIKREIDQLEDILRNKVEYENHGTKYKFSSYDLATTAFDTVVSSGAFLEFDETLQKNLTTFYFHVKEHNKLIFQLEQTLLKTLTEQVLPDTEKVLVRFYQRIVINEKSITDKYLGRVRNSMCP